MTGGRRFSGPLERLVTSAVTEALTEAAKDPASGCAKVDPEQLLTALNFALLGSGSRAFLWRSREDWVVVSDSFSADGTCRFTEVLHLSNDDVSRLKIQQYQATNTDRIEECVEAELHGPSEAWESADS
jgi:hypothetical protein